MVVVSNAPKLANLPFIAKKIRTGDILEIIRFNLSTTKIRERGEK